MQGRRGEKDTQKEFKSEAWGAPSFSIHTVSDVSKPLVLGTGLRPLHSGDARRRSPFCSEPDHCSPYSQLPYGAGETQVQRQTRESARLKAREERTSGAADEANFRPVLKGREGKVGLRRRGEREHMGAACGADVPGIWNCSQIRTELFPVRCRLCLFSKYGVKNRKWPLWLSFVIGLKNHFYYSSRSGVTSFFYHNDIVNKTNMLFLCIFPQSCSVIVFNIV